MQKNPFMLIVGEGRREPAFIAGQEEKETSVTIEEFAAIVDEEIKKHKSIYSLT
jgi:hypothetical protein